MGKLEDKILDILAEIIARLIVGAGFGIFLMAKFAGNMPIRIWRAWPFILIIGGIGVVIGALFGTRKGPGAI